MVRHAADLALTTVRLGQTDFPQLAAAIGKTTPLAAKLGVTQEELAASYATAQPQRRAGRLRRPGYEPDSSRRRTPTTIPAMPTSAPTMAPAWTSIAR